MDSGNSGVFSGASHRFLGSCWLMTRIFCGRLWHFESHFAKYFERRSRGLETPVSSSQASSSTGRARSSRRQPFSHGDWRQSTVR